MKRCSKCILPENYPNISFNEEGVCNLCVNFENKWSKHKKENFATLQSKLEHIFRWAKKKNRKYDCLVPISGGKDSAYVLYLCKFKYKLKVLAYHFDNGFVSPQAKENIRNIVEGADVDYISFAPRWELLRKMYSHLLLKTGHFCSACTLGYQSTSYKIAEKEKIPLIVVGSSRRTEGVIPKEMIYHDARWFRNVLQDEIAGDDLEDWMYYSLTKVAKRLFFGKIKYVRLPFYLDWNLDEIEGIIRKHLGWQDPSRSDHMDCIMTPVMNYLYVKKWGFGVKTVNYSARIRDGQMSQQETLKKVAVEESNDEPEIMDEFLNRLGLSRNTLKGVESMNHLDYGSYLGLISRMKWFLKLLEASSIIPKDSADEFK